MTRYIRGQLERLRERIPPPEDEGAGVWRALIRAKLDAMAEARRSGDWTEEDAARAREHLRAARERRRKRRGEA